MARIYDELCWEIEVVSGELLESSLLKARTSDKEAFRTLRAPRLPFGDLGASRKGL